MLLYVMKMYLKYQDEEHYSITYFFPDIFVGHQSVTNLLADDKSFVNQFFFLNEFLSF